VSQDEQLGYIRGKVESIQEEISEFKGEVKGTIQSHTQKEEERMASLEAHAKANSRAIEDIQKCIDIQTNTHKYIWLTIKSIAGAVFLALTVKGGDIWNYFIK